jgi:hypothetical protein
MRKLNPHIHEEFIKDMFPHINFKDYDLVDFELIENKERRTNIYEKRYWLIIEEKAILPVIE